MKAKHMCDVDNLYCTIRWTKLHTTPDNKSSMSDIDTAATEWCLSAKVEGLSAKGKTTTVV